jgi:AmmeMemoRadiSam system protein A
LRGSLAAFGSPEDQVDLPLDRAFADRLETEAARRQVRTWRIGGEPLDHGALVPLCYLAWAGWKGPTVILSLNYSGEGGRDDLGRAIAATAQALPRRIAVIASGDMSHRLTPSAPCGFHRDAHRFDELFIALLREGAYGNIRQIDAGLQEVAAEDAADSTVVALAAAGYRNDGHAVLSYEGPFGVGYGVAILFEPPPVPEAGGGAAAAGNVVSHFADLPAVARRAVESEFGGGPQSAPLESGGELQARHGVFVTVRTAKGELRGCRGTLQPVETDLVHETWHNALATAFHDYRFPPVQPAELPALRFSVTVLGELEPVASKAELDPAVFGVVVSAKDGRKGVLLPAIPGIDAVDQQLDIARRKADIGPGERISLQRFRAHSFKEPHFVEHEG